ncbi:MAG: MBOAT family O-acyltransferase [Mucilaginibacter sp.]
MLFNSVEFLFFLPVVFIIYWFVLKNSTKAQNIFILASSYLFYGWWDWRFVFLLMLSTFIDYYFGLVIYNSATRKKFFLWLSIFNNLIVLCFFKYYNFFAGSAEVFLSHLGFQVHPYILAIALPVGISFYTFHGMSYVIDIYRGNTIPTKNFVNYAAFVCFFPLLVAGPIERATHLLPQIEAKRIFSYQKALDGIRQMLWGFFKKMVVADNCAIYVNQIFDNYQTLPASTLLLGGVYFAFQIYCDFSGYSDIALGCARLFGFELLRNFAYPYFSRDIAEFWRRWHISLTTWFRDYLYIPLGGSRGTTFKIVRNTFIIFIVSGFWHGANWTFLAWGFLNALYFLPLMLRGNNRKNVDLIAKGRMLPTLREVLQMLSTFALTVFAWIFFRAASMEEALAYLKRIFTTSWFTVPTHTGMEILLPVLIAALLIIEWVNREKPHALQNVTGPLLKYKAARWSYYCILLWLIIWVGAQQQSFIYFQF